jgi:hypothetical protein
MLSIAVILCKKRRVYYTDTVKKMAFWALLCMAGIALNLGLSAFVQFAVRLPLFLDTLGTVLLTLYGGFWAGALTGVLTNIILVPLYQVPPVIGMYAICSVAAALVTSLFVHIFPGEFAPCRRCAAPQQKNLPGTYAASPTLAERLIALFAFSLALCFAMSILGGIISALLQTPLAPGIGTDLTLSRLIYMRHGLPTVVVEIMARLPVNIIDRLITAFGAYWLALLLRTILPGKLYPPPPHNSQGQ